MFWQHVPASETAAIVVEPILAEGAAWTGQPQFLPHIRKICDQHGILLIADEVRTGMGRTGKMFACQHAGVIPDILCLAGGVASGMPLGAVVAAESIMTWPEGPQGGTFGGNPVSCAGALATVCLLEDQYIANAASLGPLAISRLDRIAAKYKCVGEVRGLGLMITVEIVRSRRKKTASSELRDRILNEAFARGLLLLGCGPAGIRICPPLCINRTQLEVGLDVLDEVIATVAA
jgi:4-aminobutyrate aminotransferase